MPKLGMQPIRRQQLIDATIKTIASVGYADTTVSKIAAEAGLSVGIISHYFGGKQALLEASMFYLLIELHKDYVKRLKKASSPRARLDALIETNFSREQFQPEIVRAWLSFWAQVPFASELSKLQNIYEKRLRSNLHHDLKTLVPDTQLAETAETIATQIDGAWLRASISNSQPDMKVIKARINRTL